MVLIMRDDVLVENKQAREKVLANERSLQVLDKVKELVCLGYDEVVTINQVASYYEVGTEAVKSIVKRNNEELKEDGIKVVKKDDLKEIKGKVQNEPKLNGLYDNIKYSRQLTLFTRRAVLRVGMLLRDSKVAKTVRNYLLNIEEISTDEQIKWAVERAVSKEKRRGLTDAIQESGENERMHGHAYSTYTNMIYKLVLGMSAKKYKKMNDIDGNLRDKLNGRQLNLIKTLEDIAKAQIDLGFKYDEVKEMININYDRYEQKLLSE